MMPIKYLLETILKGMRAYASLDRWPMGYFINYV